MGFLEELGIDPDSIEATGGFDEPEAGWYDFEISEATVVHGTSKDENVVKFRITYDCYNDDGTPAGQKSEWWTLFEVDGEEPGETAIKSRGYLKGRLADLGLPASADESEIEGVRGTLRLVPNGEYTNVRNVKVAKTEEAPKAAPAARTTARTTPARTAKPNPFGKR
jgi:hypothetical protein